MTTLSIPDDLLQQAGVSEEEALLTLACALFDAGKLTLFFAAKLAGMSQPDFEQVLQERKIAIYRPTVAEFEEELKTIESHRGERP
jgi:predicted HTH domain antitoxin